MTIHITLHIKKWHYDSHIILLKKIMILIILSLKNRLHCHNYMYIYQFKNLRRAVRWANKTLWVLLGQQICDKKDELSLASDYSTDWGTALYILKPHDFALTTFRTWMPLSSQKLYTIILISASLIFRISFVFFTLPSLHKSIEHGFFLFVIIII